MRVEVGSPGITIPPIDNVLFQAKRNEEKGYDSIWWPDHLMGWIPESIWTPDIFPFSRFMKSPHLFLEPTTVIASAAMVTSKIKLGIAVTDLIRNHPAVLAQKALTLDHITKGRFVLGVGAGEVENIAPYGLPYDKVVERLEEALKVIRLLWESEGKKVYYDGKFWKLRDAVFFLPPYGDSFPQIWIGAHRNRMLEITGKLGDGWLPTYMPINEYSKKLRKIESSAKEAGRDPSNIVKGMWAYVITDEDHEECEKMLLSPFAKATALIAPSSMFEELGYEHPLGKNFYGLTDYIPSKLSRGEALEAINKVPKEVCEKVFLFGTPKELVKKIESYVRLGLSHVVLWNSTFLCDPNKLTSSFRCLEKVLNYFKGRDK